MSTEASTFDKKFNAQSGAKRAGLKREGPCNFFEGFPPTGGYIDVLLKELLQPRLMETNRW